MSVRHNDYVIFGAKLDYDKAMEAMGKSRGFPYRFADGRMTRGSPSLIRRAT